MMKKLFLVLLICLSVISITFAADFTPQGDIDLRGVYSIQNATNITVIGNVSAWEFYDRNGIVFGENRSFNQTLTDSIYIAQSEEGNLNVNSSDLWDDFDSANSTQIENNDGIFNIVLSWFSSEFDALFGAKDTDDLSEGSTNLYDDQNWNQTFADTLYSDYLLGSYNATYEGYDNTYNVTYDASVANNSFNQTLTDTLYISQSEELNLNVNSSDFWDALDTVADILGSLINNDLNWLNFTQISNDFFNKTEVDLMISGNVTDLGNEINSNIDGNISDVREDIVGNSSELNDNIAGNVSDVRSDIEGNITLINNSLSWSLDNETFNRQNNDTLLQQEIDAVNTTLNIQGIGFNTTIQLQDVFINKGNESNLNVNATDWWGGSLNWVSGWVSGWFTQTGNDLNFNDTKLNETIDQKIASITYNATTIETIYGTLDSGNISSIQQINVNTYNVSEAGGVNALLILINFTGVESFNQILLREQYLGGLGHEIELQSYNFQNSQWEVHGEITDQATMVESITNILDATDHVSDGNVSIRFIHIQNGNAGHDFIIDYIALQKGFSSITTSEHDALSGRDSLTNHPWAMDKLGTRNITGNLTVENNITADGDICISGGNCLSDADNTFNTTYDSQGAGFITDQNDELNTTGGPTFQNVTVGTTEGDNCIYFYKGSPIGESICWNNGNSRFLVSDQLTADTLVSSGVTTTFLSASQDIYTTSSGDDLWLGSGTQATAPFRAYADGSVNGTNITARGFFFGDGSFLTGLSDFSFSDYQASFTSNYSDIIVNTFNTTYDSYSFGDFSFSDFQASFSSNYSDITVNTFNVTYAGYDSTFNVTYDTKVSFDKTNVAYFNQSNVFTGLNQFISSSFSIGGDLIHYGDNDTYFSFQNDVIDIFAGGVHFFQIDGEDGNITIFNVDGLDFDFRIGGLSNPNLFFLDGSADKIGIGHTEPNTILHLLNEQKNTTLKIESSGYGNFGSLFFTRENDADVDLGLAYIRVKSTDLPGGILEFGTGGNINQTSELTRMVIDSDGNVGIGDTSPGELLEVAGNINSTGGDICISGGACLSSAGGDNATWSEERADGLYRADSWDNFTGIPHATPSNGDITHFSLADEIFDWIIGLAYGDFSFSNFQASFNSNHTATPMDYTNIAMQNQSNTFTENQNFSNNNITDLHFLKFNNGGFIYDNGTAIIIGH